MDAIQPLVIARAEGDVDVQPQSQIMDRFDGVDEPIPGEVRAALDLRAGDRISYRIEDGSVVIRKLVPVDVAHLRALQGTLSEWDSPEDAEAYDDL